jgi:hypothetical protein
LQLRNAIATATKIEQTRRDEKNKKRNSLPPPKQFRTKNENESQRDDLQSRNNSGIIYLVTAQNQTTKAQVDFANKETLIRNYSNYSETRYN